MQWLLRKRLLGRLREENRKGVKESQDRSLFMARPMKRDTKTAKSLSSQVVMVLPTNMRKSSQWEIKPNQNQLHLRQSHQSLRRALERRLPAPPTVTLRNVKECHVNQMRTVPVDVAQQPWLMEVRHVMLSSRAVFARELLLRKSTTPSMKSMLLTLASTRTHLSRLV